MKTMKLLPLKIAVTSAMLVGLGAASTANAQAQAGHYSEAIQKIQNNADNRLLKLITEKEYEQLEEGKLQQDKFQKYVQITQSANNLTMIELNRNIGTNAQKIENLKNVFDIRGRTVKKNEESIQTLAEVQQVGIKAMTELNKNVEENKESIAKNNESIDDLYEANNENVNRLIEHGDKIWANEASVQYLNKEVQNNIENIATNKADIATNKADIQKNNESIDDLYEANNENVNRLIEHGDKIWANEASVQYLNKEVQDNKADIQDLAKAQLAGVEVMTELNKNVEANKADIAKNNASIEDLYEYGQEVANSIGEIHDHNRQQNETLENLITNSTNNTDNIAKNKANIQNLAKAQLAGVGAMEELNKNVEENKADIAANKADADAKFKGVQTDIANNKTTLAEHAKKINDNQQAIEAKLGGKADLQKLSELKTSVDKNQAGIQLHDQKINNLATLFSWTTPTIGNNTKGVATNKADIAKNKDDIQNNINNIYELAQQQDQNVSDIKNLGKVSSANTDRIVKNKADADASFETLTKNQNALIEKDKAQDTLIAKNKADADASFKTLTKNQNALIEKDKAQDTLITANKADADAKFKGVQTDIANNKTTLAEHAKKINDNQQAIEAKLGGKADAQALTDLNNKVDGFDGRISALDTKVNAFDGRITALDSKVENGMAAQAALSGLFQPYSVGKFNATAALGGYGSKSAVAIGAGYRVNPNLAIKAGAAINTSGDKKGSYNIGVNYEF